MTKRYMHFGIVMRIVMLIEMKTRVIVGVGDEAQQVRYTVSCNDWCFHSCESMTPQFHLELNTI
jgi:hypothetical protein